MDSSDAGVVGYVLLFDMYFGFGVIPEEEYG